MHFEDQLSSAKKCGHMGGKVLVSDRRGHQQAGRGPTRGRRRRRADRDHRPHADAYTQEGPARTAFGHFAAHYDEQIEKGA